METYSLSRQIYNLAEVYKEEEEKRYPPEMLKIQVDDIVAKLSFLYEKIRYAIDYKEEHLLRRNAIERILKRMVISGKGNTRSTASTLIQELIRAGYIQNNHLPESKIDDTARVLEKYFILISSLPAPKNDKNKKHTINWLLSVASVEIEGTLISLRREQKTLEVFYRYIKKHLVLRNLEIPQHDHDTQLFVACHLALLKSDHAAISYYLLYMHQPNWRTITHEEIKHLASQIYQLKKHIELHVNGVLVEQLARTIRPQAVSFSILSNVMKEHASEVDSTLFDVPKLEEAIKKVCEVRYKSARKKLRRSSVNSIIYIFLTKIVIAIAVEVPYDLYVLGHINTLPLMANVIIHPLLMFAITTSTRVPGERNTLQIVQNIKNIIYNLEDEKIVHRFKKSSQQGTTSYTVVSIIYSLMFLLTYGIVILILSRLGFNLASGFLFVFFLTLITFFGIRIRNSARELVVIKSKENILTFLFDLFTLPLLRAGRWISVKSSKINIFVFIFDYIIENPFKIVVKSIEAGVIYIRQKREEVYDQN